MRKQKKHWHDVGATAGQVTAAVIIAGLLTLLLISLANAELTGMGLWEQLLLVLTEKG